MLVCSYRFGLLVARPVSWSVPLARDVRVELPQPVVGSLIAAVLHCPVELFPAFPLLLGLVVTFGFRVVCPEPCPTFVRLERHNNVT